MEPFGHAWRASWPLEPGLTYLNHGTVGVTPLRVLEAQRGIRDDIDTRQQAAQRRLRVLDRLRKIVLQVERPPIGAD